MQRVAVRFMVLAPVIEGDNAVQGSTDAGFAASRQFAIAGGAMVLPFLLVAPQGRPGQIVSVVAVLLIPSLAGLLLARRWTPGIAAIGQYVVQGAATLTGLAFGFGAGWALTMAIVALLNFVIGDRSVAFGRVGVLAIAVSALMLVSMMAEGGVELAAVHVPAYLALLPSLVEIAFQLDEDRQPRSMPTQARSLADALSDCVMGHTRETALLLDRGGRAVTLGSNVATVFGASASDLMGRGFMERVHLSDRPELLAACAAAATGESRSVTLRLRVADHGAGMQRFDALDATIHPFEDTEHVVIRIGGKANVSGTEASDRLGSPVPASRPAHCDLSELSHAVRTPLNAIIGFSNLLITPDTQPQQAGTISEYGRMIHESGLALRETVETLVDLTRLRAGAHALKHERLDLISICACAEAHLQKRFADDRVSLHLETDGRVGDWICDRRAALAMVTGAAAILLAAGRSHRLSVTASWVDARIELRIRAVDASGEVTADRRMPPQMALEAEFAGVLAAHLGGNLHFAALNHDVCLTVQSVTGAICEEAAPVDLDAFRRSRQEQPRMARRQA